MNVTKIPEIINIQGRKIDFAHGFRSFSPCLLGTWLGPIVPQNIMAEVHGRQDLFVSQQPRRREKKGERRRVRSWGSNIPVKSMPQMT